MYLARSPAPGVCYVTPIEAAEYRIGQACSTNRGLNVVKFIAVRLVPRVQRMWKFKHGRHMPGVACIHKSADVAVSKISNYWAGFDGDPSDDSRV